MKALSAIVLALIVFSITAPSAAVNEQFTTISCAPLPPLTQYTMNHKRTQTCDLVDLSAGVATKSMAYRCERSPTDGRTHTGRLEFYFDQSLTVAAIPQSAQGGSWVLFVGAPDTSVPGRLVINVQHNRVVKPGQRTLSGFCYLHVTLTTQ